MRCVWRERGVHPTRLLNNCSVPGAHLQAWPTAAAALKTKAGKKGGRGGKKRLQRPDEPSRAEPRAYHSVAASADCWKPNGSRPQNHMKSRNIYSPGASQWALVFRLSITRSATHVKVVNKYRRYEQMKRRDACWEKQNRR